MNRKFFIVSCFLVLSPFLNAQIQKGFDIDEQFSGAFSGRSVSMPDANTIAIGTPFDGLGECLHGWARIFTWSGTEWEQKGGDIYAGDCGDGTGYMVSMPDHNTVAIGAQWRDGNGEDAGSVSVYIWDGTDWEQKGTDIYGESAGDKLGSSVCMPDANTVAIGAPWNDGNDIDAGHVRIYSWSGAAWEQKGSDIDGEAAEDDFGKTVSMPDASTIAIGAPGNDGNGELAGHVRIYSWSGTAWVQKGADIDGQAAGDWFGDAVSMPDANTVAIGSSNDDGISCNPGYVRIYAWSGIKWEQKGKDIDGEECGDWFGDAVSMPDANTVAIGASGNDGNGYNAGHVRIYSWSGTAWVQKGTDIDGESAEDYSGSAVSMPDANTIAIGAPDNNENSGHVRVYTLGK